MNPTLWSHLWRIGKIAGFVAAITGAVVSVAAAWPLIEPYLVAHRGYVRDYTAGLAEKSQSTIRDIQIEQAEGKLDQIEESIFKWNVEINKTSDEQSKSMIQGRVHELMGTKKKLQAQIDTLNQLRH